MVRMCRPRRVVPALVAIVTLGAVASGCSSASGLDEDNLAKIRALNGIAAAGGQTRAQLAIAWTLRDQRVTSTLIGASSVQQLEDNVAALDKLEFTADELSEIDKYATESGINLWARSSQSS